MTPESFTNRLRTILPLLIYIAFGIWIILMGLLIGSVTSWNLEEMLPLGIPALVTGPSVILLSVSGKLRWMITFAAWLHLLISLALSPLAIPAAWINTGAAKALFHNALYVLFFILFPIAVIVVRHLEKKAIMGRGSAP